MSLSNIQRSLRSSRAFLLNLKNRMSSGDTQRSYKTTPKSFTFDHGEFPRAKKESSSSNWRWFIIAPVALVLALAGLGFTLILTLGLFFMHCVKMLWEGKGRKPHSLF